MSVKNTKGNFVKRTGLLGNFISGKYEGHSVNQVSSSLGYGYISATGGETVTDSGYTYHVFVQPGTFSISSGESPIECLVVAGGASGGADGYHSGGGGAGGILYASSFLVSEGNSFPISVGSGGAAVPNISSQSPPYSYPRGNDGSPSHIGIITAIGGGGGGNYSGGAPLGDGAPGGSGGGGGWASYVGGLTLQTSVDSFVGYGNSGGNGGGSPAGAYGAGGGGGAGAAGGNGTPSVGGNGGAGQPFPNFPAPVLAPALTAAGVPAPEVSAWTSVVGPTGVFGGGGGGSTYDPSPTLFATGGPGGGGDGGNITIASKPAINYTGGGGGTQTHNPGDPSGAGGNGIVLIRYQTS